MTGTEETGNNICMLYEAANKTPVYEAYQKLCKFRGNFDIDYVDFEQKYYRFYHGNSELKSADRISSKTFSDLPIDILKIVINDLELTDELILRKVSKSLRSIIDGPKFVSSIIFIHLEANSSQIGLERNYVNYSDKHDEKTYEVKTRPLDSDGNMKINITKKPRVIGEEHWESMIRDLSTFLCNPNWKFSSIHWIFDENKLDYPDIRQKQLQLIENMLKTTSLQVKNMSICSKEPTTVMAILPYVIPVSLEYLSLHNNGPKLEEIMELEQWKKLKSAYVDTVPDSFSIEHFFHLEAFSIDQIRFSEDRLVKIRDILFKSTKFSRCTLRSEIEDQVNVDGNGEAISSLRELIIAVNRIMGEHPEYNADTRCYSIPDSDEHFFVYPCENHLSFELKIKRVKNGQEDIENSFEEF
ncbi:hypothetical protein CAEBREN_18261 [Caenorhabditis brenneri]|uniref:F-box domain-containing protein n=1 Tax=Caenorhabditis brenneri TaxID=135651 RepID=G0P0S5_CAEBE|nr:hypothetical protein CAEBREN_18261 [Caenorhabditis brenneri]